MFIMTIEEFYNLGMKYSEESGRILMFRAAGSAICVEFADNEEVFAYGIRMNKPHIFLLLPSEKHTHLFEEAHAPVA